MATQLKSAIVRESGDRDIPLCVDLDGTLIRSDILWEQIVQCWRKPGAILRAAWNLRHGKPSFKQALASDIAIDPAALPYREELLTYLRSEHENGRKLVLATATHDVVARQIADHLGLFDEVIATKDGVNLDGQRKQKALEKAFGERRFDYIGDHQKDLAVFASARYSLLAEPSSKLQKQAAEVGQVTRLFGKPGQSSKLKVLLRALRVHQWAKNALLGVPLITAHLFASATAWANLITAFVCFSLLASATYQINDLHDLAADRKHLHKRSRPLASGDLPIPYGLGLAFGLAGISFAVAFAFLSKLFVGFLVLYSALTLFYSFDLKRRVLVDVLALASLYTLRILAGGAAIQVTVSEWLLMFSLFIFTSLAFLKRAIELKDKKDDGVISGRGYLPMDIEIIKSIGPSAGLMSVLVLTLYINSPEVTTLYREPGLLWFLCPVFVYWISRIWFLAWRGQVHHDPILFSMVDSRTYLVAIISMVIIILADIGWQGLGII